MSLPGLDLSEAVAESSYAPPPPAEVNLRPGSEWRFEIAFGATVRVKLLSGTAELFGTELAPSQTYTFSGTKAAIYTWHGCTLEITAGDSIPLPNGFAPGGSPSNGQSMEGGRRGQSGLGGCQSEYVAEETPMVEYANVHFALETMRHEAESHPANVGPRVLILGPENAGKTSLAKILTAYATKSGRQPVLVNLDPTEGVLSVPGTLSATAFRTMIDIEEGWGSSPMSGPSPVPVKLPLVYFYPMQNPLEAGGSVYRPLVSRLGLSVIGRFGEDDDARQSGIIVDTPGILSSGKPGSLEMIHHIITELSISTVIVIGSERLYSPLVKKYDQQPTSKPSSTTYVSAPLMTDERISVIKLSKSGGCVDRDPAFMKGLYESQIRTYFFGNATSSTSASALSVPTGLSANKITLSPHAQQLDFNSISLFQYVTTAASSGSGNFGDGDDGNIYQDDDSDEYEPDFLPGGGGGGGGGGSENEPSNLSADPPLKKLTGSPPAALANTLVAIMHAPTNAPPAEIRDASVMGFLYVADVDAEKNRVRVLAPIGGRMPANALIWGKKWPGEVVGLVG